MKEAVQFLRKLHKKFPEIDMGLEYSSDFYSFMDGKMCYDFSFSFKNYLDNDYVRLKSKNLREPFYQKCLKNLTKYKIAYDKEMERQKKPKKFVVED
jgi:hypothetical protein